MESNFWNYHISIIESKIDDISVWPNVFDCGQRNVHSSVNAELSTPVLSYFDPKNHLFRTYIPINLPNLFIKPIYESHRCLSIVGLTKSSGLQVVEIWFFEENWLLVINGGLPRKLLDASRSLNVFGLTPNSTIENGVQLKNRLMVQDQKTHVHTNPNFSE